MVPEEVMRHRKRGRVLGRAPSHRKAMLKNLASALFLTERNAEDEENEPEIKGRIITLAKPRLGDAGPRAILEFVGVRDRQVQRAEKPTFSDEVTETAKA